MQQKIYISTVSAGQTGKAPSLYARRFLCFRIRFRIRKAVYGSEAAGIKAAAALQSGEDFGSAKDTERCIWRKIRHFSRHVRPRLPKRRALPKRQRPLLPFAQAAVRRPRRLFCRKTFVRRLARRLSAVLRVGGHASAARAGFTSAHEKIGKSGVLSVDGPRGKPSGRRKRKSAKSRRCEAGRPARELPSGGECRPKTLFAGPTRQAAGEFCRNTQVRREVIHLSTRLSTMPAFYAVKKPQKRAGKERTGKGEFPRERALI